MITVVIPLRLSLDRLYDEAARIARICDTLPKELYTVLIVDYGTPDERRSEIDEICGRFPNVSSFRYETIEAFSIGHARDIGAQQANTEIIFFHDIDFLCTEQGYRSIYQEVLHKRLAISGYSFICVPTIFLTRYGTDYYINKHGTENDQFLDREFHDYSIREDTIFYQHYTTGSSALIVNRFYYLGVGGHDRSFSGHGAEDFELFHRMESYAPRGPKPPSYYEDVKSPGMYKGFRSFFSLFGIDLWMRGVCMVHLEHPRREKFDATYRRTSDNFKLLRQRMVEFDRHQIQIPPLPDPKVKEKTLLLMSPSSLPAKALRFAIPALGSYDFIEEGAFSSSKDLGSYVIKNGYTQILFLNPYANSHREELYDGVRSQGLRTISFDRGALPESWFFDRCGFLNSSQSYDLVLWDKALSDEQEIIAREYIKNLTVSGATLEENGARQGPDYWRNRLALGNKKIIFVALQRPNDVATRKFCGAAVDCDTFNDWISDLAAQIDRRRYHIVIKKHPLESKRPEISNAVWAPADANIYDLIDLSDKVVVINSGVGLLSLIMNKPVICCGDAFYSRGGMCNNVKSSEELISLCHSNNLQVPYARVLRFTYYLIENFYSFGSAIYVTKENSKGEKIRIASSINISKLRIYPDVDIELGKKTKRWNDDAFLLTALGRRKKPSSPPATTRNEKSSAVSAASDAEIRVPNPLSLGPAKRILFWIFKFTSGPLQGYRAREKMRNDPVAFFLDAKNPINRIAGGFFASKIYTKRNTNIRAETQS